MVILQMSDAEYPSVALPSTIPMPERSALEKSYEKITFVSVEPGCAGVTVTGAIESIMPVCETSTSPGWA